MIVTVIVIVAIALCGLTMINIDSVRADRNVVTAEATSIKATPEAGITSGGGVESASEPSLMAAIAKMVSALAIVILVVYGALYALRKLMGRKYSGAGGHGSLEVLETTYVGQHKTISLVRVGDRSVLVGVTDQQISTLTELDADETATLTSEVARPVASGNFSRALSTAAGKLKFIGLKKKRAALEI
jgi:flagellar biosynthetic protein FliO